jgi:hypothetical protein
MNVMGLLLPLELLLLPLLLPLLLLGFGHRSASGQRIRHPKSQRHGGAWIAQRHRSCSTSAAS